MNKNMNIEDEITATEKEIVSLEKQIEDCKRRMTTQKARLKKLNQLAKQYAELPGESSVKTLLKITNADKQQSTSLGEEEQKAQH